MARHPRQSIENDVTTEGIQNIPNNNSATTVIESASVAYDANDEEMSEGRQVLPVFQAEPLAWEDTTGGIHSMEWLNLDLERDNVNEALEGTNVNPVFIPATPDLLSKFLAEGRTVLHLSCHGHSAYAAIENGWGGLWMLKYEDLIQWIRAGRKKLNFVFISACQSREAGDALLHAGVVDHVVCCREKGQDLRSDVGQTFTRHFYRALAHGKTIEVAFELGLQGVKNSGINNVEEGMKQFALLPEHANHDVCIFGSTSLMGNQAQIEPMVSCEIPHSPWPIGREVDMYNILHVLHDARLVRLTGPQGMGKGTVAKAIGGYLNKRKTWGVTIWLRAAKDSTVKSLYFQLYHELLQCSQELSSHHITDSDIRVKVRHLLLGKKAVVIVDARRASDESMKSVGGYLHDLFELAKQVKVIAVHPLGNRVCSPDPSGYPFIERDYILKQLGFTDTALIFAENCPHITFKSKKLPGELKRRYSDDMFRLLGEGVPSRILIAAKNITFEECSDKLLNKDYKVELNDFGRCYQLQQEHEEVKNIDVYFAMQLPSTMLDNLSHRPKHISVLQSVAKSIKRSRLEGLKALDSIYLTDAKRKDIETDFRSSRVRLLVWCSEGVDESGGNHEELSLGVFRDVFKSQKPPEVAVVCMLYGAKLVASALQRMGVAKIIWIRVDPYARNLLSQRVKMLLSFCSDVLSDRVTFAESFENLRDKASKLDPCCECDYYVDNTLGSPGNQKISVEMSVPDVTVKLRACCTSDWFFKSRDLKKLKLDFADIQFLDDMKREVLENGRLEENRRYFLIPHSRERKENWDRARALALYVCNEIAKDEALIFDNVYRIASKADSLIVQREMEEQSDRALVWVDFADKKDAPFDSADETVDWIDGFGEGPTLVLLFTAGASYHDLVDSIVSGLDEVFEGEPKKELSAPEGPEIALGQLNVLLSVLPYVDANDGTTIGILDRIRDASLVRDAVMQFVGDGEFAVMDSWLNQVKVYRDDDSITRIRVCIGDLADLKRLLDFVFIGEGNKRIGAALSQNVDVIRFDYSAFATYYEKVMMQMDTLTDHQHKKMAQCKAMEMVRIEGGAGTGKTFIALNVIIDYLRRHKEEMNYVLYVCRNISLAFHFAKWLCHRVATEEVSLFLSRMHFLTDDKDYPTGFMLKLKAGTLKRFRIPSSNQSLTYGRIVVDEAHDVFRKRDGRRGNVFRETVGKMIQCNRQASHPEEGKPDDNDRFQLMLLSDISQAAVPENEICYPSEGLEVVELTEVCRSSKRVIAGAMGFQLTAKTQISFAHESDGLPLRSYLFSPAIRETSRFPTYAKRVVEAIKDILTCYHDLDLHDRLAVIVPDDGFRKRLCEGKDGLADLLDKSKDNLGQYLVPVCALEASRAVNLGTNSHDKRCIIVDTVAEMDGLERLVVIGVGLDESIGDDKQRLKLVCSRIYRAFTRAHLIFCVVNERIPGGWYEWIDQIDKKLVDFSFEKAVKCSNNAAVDMMASVNKSAASPSMLSSEPVLEHIPDKDYCEKIVVESVPAVPFEGRHSTHEETTTKKLPNLGIFVTDEKEEGMSFNDNVEAQGFLPFENDETTENSFVSDEITTASEGSVTSNRQIEYRQIESPKVIIIPVGGITEALSVSTTSTSLDLSFKSIGAEGAGAIADALRFNRTVMNVDLHNNSIGVEGAAAIGDALRVNKTVTNVDLGDNAITDEGAAAIAEALRVNTTLVSVGLYGISIGAKGAMAIAGALRVNKTVKNVNLYCNSIGDEGAAAVAEALRCNKSVKNVDIGDNSVGDKGAAAIVDALRVNTTLASIDLSYNSIGDEGALAIAEALRVNKTIKNVNLYENSIGSEGATAIADALLVNTTVTDVGLERNSIGAEGAVAIAEALRVNTTLTNVHLGGNFVGDEARAAIDQALRRNNTDK